MKKEKLGKWMARKLDGHGIYSEGVLDDLKEFGVTYDKKKCLLVDDDTNRGVIAPVDSPEEMIAKIEARGKGGGLRKGADNCVSGSDLARKICELAGISDPGARFHGIGRAFDARVSALIGD